MKWSYEPPRAAGRARRARARRSTSRRCRPQGPAFVSIPMDDWDVRGGRRRGRRTSIARTVTGRAVADPDGGRARSRARLEEAKNPVLVAGPDIDAQRRLGRRGRARRAPAACRCGPRPPPGGGRLGFPEGHPNFQGVLPPAIGPGRPDARGPRPRARRRLVGVPLLPLHPRPAAAGGHGAGRDHERPRRGGARADGRRDRRRRARSRSRRCSRRVGETDRPPPEPLGDAAAGRGLRPARAPAAVHATLARGRCPTTGSSCSSRRPARSRCATSCGSREPGSYFFGAGGGLGFGLSAGDRRAARRSPTARWSACSARARRSTRSAGFWTAVAYEVPVTFLILRNEEYGILKWFAESRAGHRRARARPAGARHRGDRRGLRRRRRGACAAATSCARRSTTRSPSSAPRARRGRRRARACRCSDGAARRSTAARSRAGRRPRARRAGGRHAGAAARRELVALLGADRVLHARARPRALRLRREPLPADPAGGRHGARRRRRREGARATAGAPASR